MAGKFIFNASNNGHFWKICYTLAVASVSLASFEKMGLYAREKLDYLLYEKHTRGLVA